MKRLDFSRFQASADIWEFINLGNLADVKACLDNYFDKLRVDYVMLRGPCNINKPEDKTWWDEILSYSREKGYVIAPVCMGPGGAFWEAMSPMMLKYIYSKYSDVIQVILFESEHWSGRYTYIKPDKILLPGTDEKSDRENVVVIPLKETEIGRDLKNTYTGMTKVMKLTLGKNLKKIYEAAPEAKLIISDPWILPEITALLNEPYGKNIIPAKKSFGSTDIRAYKDLVREGSICGWGVQLSADGGPFPHYTPEYMERLLKRCIVEGACTWELQDTYFGGDRLFDNPASLDAKLTDWGKALRRAIDFGHRYNENKTPPTAWSPDSYISLLSYPNNTPSDSPIFQQLAIIEANRIFCGIGLPAHADNPFLMQASRVSSWGKEPWVSSWYTFHHYGIPWYTPPYDLEDFKYFDFKTFHYTTCITSKTKVAILVGPGAMDEFTVDRLEKFCQQGGYVIQACGAYIHDPETGKEMLEFEGLEVDKESKEAFIYPKPSQIRTSLLKRIAGFVYQETDRIRSYFKCKVVNKDTPLISFDYSTEYTGSGNAYCHFFFLKGALVSSSTVVMNIYDEEGNGYPLLIYHPIGKGGVYTVLSWSLEGMTCDFLSEFMRKWFHDLVSRYEGNILKRAEVNIYDYEVYAGRLLDWKEKPYIEINEDQKIGIVKNYLNKPIKRTFLIRHESIEMILFDEEQNVKEIKLIRGEIPQKIPVSLQPRWSVVFEKTV